MILLNKQGEFCNMSYPPSFQRFTLMAMIIVGLIAMGVLALSPKTPIVYAATISEAEPNDSLETAQSLSAIGLNNPVNGSIDPAGDRDWYSFEVEVGKSYVIELYNVDSGLMRSGGANCERYREYQGMALIVYDTTGTEQHRSCLSTSGGNVHRILAFTAKESGTHYVQAFPHSDAENVFGSYSLRILPKHGEQGSDWNDTTHEPNGHPHIAYEIQPGMSHALTTEITERNVDFGTNDTDTDWYRFEAIEGQYYVIELFDAEKQIAASGGSKCERYRDYAGLAIEVYDSSLANIQTSRCNPHGRANVHTIVGFAADASDTFYIKVYPNSSSSKVYGSYSIRVLPPHKDEAAEWDSTTFEPNNDPSIAYEITVGATNALSTSIEQQSPGFSTNYADVDWYRFQAKEGQTYTIEVFDADKQITAQTGNNCERYYDYAGLAISVYDSSIANIQTSRCSPYGPADVHTIVRFKASTSDFFYIKVYPNSNSSKVYGAYGIRVLPHHDDEAAEWNSTTFEPNNSSSNAYEIGVGRTKALTSTIEPRSSRFSTNYADVDWYRFEATADQSYVVELFDVASSLAAEEGNNCYRYGDYSGLAMFVYGEEVTDPAISAEAVAGKCSPDEGVGNVHRITTFTAKASGTFYIVVYPQSNVVAGDYGIRVLPSYDEPEASWDLAMEPNNRSIHAYPLEPARCGRVTTIEKRRQAFVTNKNDHDWYAIETEADKEYIFDIYDLDPAFGEEGLTLRVYDAAGDIVLEGAGNNYQGVLTAEYDGFYHVLVYPNSNASGSYRIRAVPADGPECSGRPNPTVSIQGCSSMGINPENGQVTLRGNPRRGCDQTFTREVTCESGVTPSNVRLNIGNSSFPMESIGDDKYQVTINTSTDLPSRSRSMDISVSKTCDNEVPGTQTIIVGIIVFFDPSGDITDASTGEPVENAEVTIYRVPEALPDSEGETRDCRTTETRSGDDWSSLPAANIEAGVVIDPILDKIQGTDQISPTINPQITGNDGSYAWDVVEGCWFVTVEAEGYEPMTSPLVGVPPEVTDLHLALTPTTSGSGSGKELYLPLVRQNAGS
jgi:hypothetical protein